jgi:protease I
MSQGKKLLMLVGDFVEDYEAMVPYQLLTYVSFSLLMFLPTSDRSRRYI